MNDDDHFADMRFTFEFQEFKSVAELRKKLKPLSVAIFGYGKINGLLTKEDFQRATSHKVVNTDNVVDIIYRVFDANSDGNLSSEEFFRVLQKRERDMACPSGFCVPAFFMLLELCKK